jgi:methionyl-tRNA synthetase
MDSAKMSKSLGNVVRPRPIVHVLGMDALRYYLLRETVFGQDGNFSYDALVQRYNSDLANGLGNLASRVLSMIERYFGGAVPQFRNLSHQDMELGGDFEPLRENVLRYYDALEFTRVLEWIWSQISTVDKYLTAEQPWAEDKDPQRRANVLWTAAEAIRAIAALAHPILPDATTKIWKLLGQDESLGSQNLAELRWGGLIPGRQLGRSQPLFPRIEKAEAIERMEAMENEAQKQPSPVTAPAAASTPTAGGAATAAAPAAAEKIGIEDFAKVEMRVGQIKTAERIVGADKLLKLTVDIGTEIRQICAGIAQYYEPEKLVGRKVAVVVNLAPRKLRGVESNGMIIAATVGPEGRPVLAGFPDEDVEIGARLK